MSSEETVSVCYHFSQPPQLGSLIVTNEAENYQVLGKLCMIDYLAASECYEALVTNFPEVEQYRIYYAEALYNAFMFQESMTVVSQVESSAMQPSVTKLQAAIKYGEDDLQNARTLVEQCPADDPDTHVNLACLVYKEGNYAEAIKRFQQAMQIQGYKADLAYNISLCHYQTKDYSQALKSIAEIIERGIHDHPELGVGMVTEGVDVRSVGNTLTLQETSLVEAFNLKAAIEYAVANKPAAVEALTDMPPRAEHELDPVTLHNHALANVDEQPQESFAKLHFLLEQPVLFPKETFSNLLLLYCKYEYYDMVADVMAQNAELTYTCLDTFLYNYLDGVITQQTAQDEAFRKFENMLGQQAEQLRKVMKLVQDARSTGDSSATRQSVKAYDTAMEKYLPVLMGQAKMYWDMEQYVEMERIFHKSAEFCNENNTWKLNAAHVLFMQDNKFREAAAFYEPIVKAQYEKIIDVSAIVLANLCVCYIMTNQNEEAEELMRKVEKEEEAMAFEDPSKKLFHLCIINLVIGTLYCSKGNYEFGISRVIKAMEPYSKKLGTDTWYYAKRCFLSLIENLTKQMILVRDSVLNECLEFMGNCEEHGRTVKTIVEGPLGEAMDEGKNCVTYEARYLKALLLEVLHD